MNVLDVMSREPRAVRTVDRLGEAARILWEQDCGFVPVVDGAAAARPSAMASAKVLATVAAITKPRSGGRDFSQTKPAAHKKAPTQKGPAKKPAKKAAAKKPAKAVAKSSKARAKR